MGVVMRTMLLVWCASFIVKCFGGIIRDDPLLTNDVHSDFGVAAALERDVKFFGAQVLNAEDLSPPKSNEDSYTGLYSQQYVAQEDYEVTVPVRVAKDGGFLSRDLRATHDEVHRSKRSLKNNLSVDDDDDDDDEDDVNDFTSRETVHYNITVGGRPLRLDLKPELRFISPHLVVERRGGGIGSRFNADFTSSKCHFRGNIAGQPASTVALSACDGLAGLLRTEHGEYWVEPSLQHTPTEDGADHPHVIYKRSAVRNPGHNNNQFKFNNHKRRNNQKNGEHKKRKGGGKKRRGHRKRRNKNCGTKQPPRDALEVQYREGPGKLLIQQTRPERHNRQANDVLSDGRGQRAGRGPRSVSRKRHVEVLLVADSTMTDFHHKGNVETYLLTIMNMVSSLYQDPTIGNYINIVVVKIILLEDEAPEPRLNITTNADTTLSNFCRWQRDLNPADDTHPNHHDVAILITRKDICARQSVPCSTLGVAHVAGMCLPDRSCSVNEDNGITLAHTITHELGHNFGMYHDTLKIGCHRRVGSTLHVMTPIFEADTIEVAWSKCSRRDLTNFLDSGMGECLADRPAQVDYIYPELPPGALYDAGRQCRLQFGAEVDEVCTSLSEICLRLWCMVNGTCITMLRPAAPGTSCGNNMWCQNQECVVRASPPPPEHGGWGAWSPWSACSRTCGAGVSITRRQCNNPLPSHGGDFCTGERTRYQICNTDPCSKSEPSFRQSQCSKYDNTTHEDKLVQKWQPYFDQDEPCELYCSTAEDTVIVPFGEFALDGTPCNLGTRDMCIMGICRKVGCDWIVDSNATEDACGICNGFGNECKQVQGIYSKGTTKESGYSEVAVIPAGSKNIKVEEVSNSKNYIGIGSARSRRFYLNGRRKITLAGEYLVAGTPALYERDRDWEKIRIPGPIKEDILIYQMIYRGRHRNPGVRYQYTVDKAPQNRSENYHWGTAEWGPCNTTCGGGVMRRPVVCYDGNTAVVDQEYCINNNDHGKPSELMRVCNSRSCSAYWSVGPWSQCPPCLKQNHHTHQRKRRVFCLHRTDNRLLADDECDHKYKPTLHIPCTGLAKCSHRN